MDARSAALVRRIAEFGTLSAAARDLGLSQSALTKSLARLEDQVGARLFDRGPRGMVATPSGEHFLARMESVEAELRSLERDMRALGRGRGGEIALGVGQFWLGRILPVTIGRMTRAVPDVRFRIMAGPREETVARLRRGEVDLVLGRVADDLEDGLTGVALADVRMSLLARKDHPLLSLDRPVTHGDTLGFGWILPAGDDPTIRYAFTEHGLPAPDAVVLSVSRSLTTGLLLETDMLTVMPEINGNRLPSGLVRVPTTWMGWSRRAGVIRRRDRTLLPICDTFTDLLRDVIGDLQAA